MTVRCTAAWYPPEPVDWRPSTPLTGSAEGPGTTSVGAFGGSYGSCGSGRVRGTGRAAGAT
ncbi:hypothetical protein [Corynebacterium provencense]|uniref:hypothetical protein n=1 Tax=Corynebacterium provencense TaxID=1737425 RepID=UPI00164D1F6B